jgi:hypothetical protein
MIYFNLHLLSKYEYFKLQCHLRMMDNEIVTINKGKYDDETRIFSNFLTTFFVHNVIQF